METKFISENLNRVKAQLPPNVTLVAVSKTKPAELLQAAYDAGQRDFGENYVQELVDKQALLPKEIRWHFIGHLQSNKVKYIAPFVHLIHGVDSFKLLKEIDKQGEKCGRVINCLLQIFIAKEETKFGFDADECRLMLESEAFRALQHVIVIGLMGMASNTDSEEIVRSEYASLSNLFQELKEKQVNFKVLSAGMSGDFETAIRAGSNMVRIGSSIFGQRIYS